MQLASGILIMHILSKQSDLLLGHLLFNWEEDKGNLVCDNGGRL